MNLVSAFIAAALVIAAECAIIDVVGFGTVGVVILAIEVIIAGLWTSKSLLEW